MALAPGARIGPYEVQSAIGAGGMGQVYRARDTRLDRIVAIKVLPEHVASDPEARQRLEREGRAISSLNHPHICTLFDVGQDNNTDYLVMEYIDGRTLAERLASGSRALSLSEALTLATQIAMALDKIAQSHRSASGEPVVIVKEMLQPLNIGRNYDITPDGRVVAAIPAPQRSTRSGEIIVVLNWAEKLKRRVPIE